MNAIVLFANENQLEAKIIEPDIITKPLNGKPKIRWVEIQCFTKQNPIANVHILVNRRERESFSVITPKYICLDIRGENNIFF